MRRVIVTGSNGFVGGHVAARLRDSFEVVGVGAASAPRKPVDRYVRWDLGSEGVPDELLSIRVDCIVHAAACLSRDDDDLALTRVNCVGAQQVFSLALRSKPAIVILISSLPIVGGPPEGPIGEGAPMRPPTMYHATKASQELILAQLPRHGVRYAALRLPSPVGPGQPGGAILPTFLEKALAGEDIVLLGQGTRRQNYVDVRDVARAVSLLAESESASGVYNMGASAPVSNAELAAMCAAVAGGRSRIVRSGEPDPQEGDVWDVDSRKIRAELGFECGYSLEDTLRDMASEAGGPA